VCDGGIIHRLLPKLMQTLKSNQGEKAETPADAAIMEGLRLLLRAKTAAAPPGTAAQGGDVEPQAGKPSMNAGAPTVDPQADKPELDDEARLRVRVGGTWYDISDEAMRMLRILFKAEGAWVQGSTISKENRPDKTRKRMPAAVSAIIESHKRHGYRIPSLLPQ